jgi:exoribonuclease-2
MTQEYAGRPVELSHRAILQRLARQAMLERGLLPDFAPEALAELGAIRAGMHGPDEPAGGSEPPPRDLRDLPWASIDNDDSRDLDQLTVAQAQPGGAVRILVAVADVAGTVRRGTALDEHARHNTTSVYTPARVFPMLPEALSTDLTSLNCDGERPAIVVDLVIAADGTLQASPPTG